MDKNLFLLKPEELYLFQLIEGEQKERIMNCRFSFCETRKNLNLIIVSKREDVINAALKNTSSDIIEKIQKEADNEIGKIKENWEDEERRIRKAIESERQRRENPDNREDVDPWPELPNSEDEETREPHPVPWNILPVDDNNELLNEITEEVREASNINNNGRISFLTNQFERLNQNGDLMDMINLYDDELSNYHLMLLDDRLMQLRQNQIRLNDLMQLRQNQIRFNNGDFLGYLLRAFDCKGEETNRTIYLFLDNIQEYADSKGINRIEVLATVYVHELFHAYYSNTKAKKNYLITCIREIEESMAEFGMLCFIKANFQEYFQTAYDNVKEKKDDQHLWCYFLGASLYDIMNTNGIWKNTFNGRILEVYHAIQRSVRNSYKLIISLKGILQAQTLDEYKYFTQLIALFGIHRSWKLLHPHRNTIKDSYHYVFDGNAYGRNTDVIYKALEYYAIKTNATWQDITIDFATLCNQASPCFCDIRRVPNPNDYNIQKMISLQDTDIVLKKIWRTDINGDMFKFMKEVDKLNRSGRLDKKILYIG